MKYMNKGIEELHELLKEGKVTERELIVLKITILQKEYYQLDHLIHLKIMYHFLMQLL